MSSRAVPAPLAQLPNALTVARLALIPVFVLLELAGDSGHSRSAAIVFGAAGVTDQIDGWLARRWRVESQFGKIFDPLADRLMIDAAVILLWLDGRLPWAALVIIGARDLLLVVGYKVLEPRGVDVEVNALGKLATWILYAGLAAILATAAGTDWPLWIFWIGLGLAIAAFVIYARDAWKVVRR